MDYFPCLHLGGCHRKQLAHLGANRLFGNGDVLGGKIGRELTQDVGIAGLLEIGRDHLLGIGGGGIARHAQLFGRPQPEQPVAAGLRLEFLLLVEGVLLLETFLALVELAHALFQIPLNGAGAIRCDRPAACLHR